MNLTNSQLFIPRKQNLTGASGARTYPVIQPLGSQASGSTGYDPSTVNAQHLEDALRENFLAIQNWANQRAVSGSVHSSTQQTLANNVNTTLQFDTKNWDWQSIASTSAQTITVPARGVYLVNAGVSFSAIPGQTHTESFMSPGGQPAQHGFILGSTAGTWSNNWAGVLILSKGTSLSVTAAAQMPNSSDTCMAGLDAFTITKLFDVPSRVQ